MELRHLRYFSAVADAQSFTRASERLGLSQPALSHQIRQLEEEIGGRLFDRLGRRIQLTPLGAAFLEEAETALRAVERGCERMRAMLDLDGGLLRVGAIQSFNSYLIPPVAAAFRNAFPNVRLSIAEHSAPRIEAMLLAGELDLGLSFAPPENEAIAAETLFDEPLVVAVDRARADAWCKPVTLTRLAGAPLALLAPHMFTRRLTDRAFLDAGEAHPPAPAVETNTIESLVRVIQGTDLVTVLPERVIHGREEIHAVPLEPRVIRRAAALRRRGAWLPPVTQEFMNTLRRSL